MSESPAPATDVRVRILDIAERVLILILFAGLVANIRHGLVLRPANVILVVHEALTVFFILTRRKATRLTLRPLDWIAAILGSGLPLIVRPGGPQYLDPAVGTTLMAGGFLLALSSLLFLRRSFGMAAANRGVVQGGPYRFVRHPIYLGYLCAHLGFFLNNPSWWNAGVYLAATGFQIYRILAEERVLTDDPVYAEYRRKVRWRLAPGVF